MTTDGCGLNYMLTTSYCFHSWVDPLITKPKQNKRKQKTSKQTNKQKTTKPKPKPCIVKQVSFYDGSNVMHVCLLHIFIVPLVWGNWVNLPLLFLFVMTLGEAGCVTYMWHRGQRTRGFMFEPYACVPFDITQWGNLVMHFSESVLVVKQYMRIDS